MLITHRSIVACVIFGFHTITTNAPSLQLLFVENVASTSPALWLFLLLCVPQLQEYCTLNNLCNYLFSDCHWPFNDSTCQRTLLYSSLGSVIKAGKKFVLALWIFFLMLVLKHDLHHMYKCFNTYHQSCWLLTYSHDWIISSIFQQNQNIFYYPI